MSAAPDSLYSSQQEGGASGGRTSCLTTTWSEDLTSCCCRCAVGRWVWWWREWTLTLYLRTVAPRGLFWKSCNVFVDVLTDRQTRCFVCGRHAHAHPLHATCTQSFITCLYFCLLTCCGLWCSAGFLYSLSVVQVLTGQRLV